LHSIRLSKAENNIEQIVAVYKGMNLAGCQHSNEPESDLEESKILDIVA
jgi:hypothetical protein